MPVEVSPAPARRGVELAAVVVPPLVLAAVGLTHPMLLSTASAEHWRDLHIGLLPVFPLLAVGPWLAVRREPAAVRWAVAVLGYVFAAFYTALDAIAGIGAGAVKLRVEQTPAFDALFDVGNALALVGTWAFLVAAVLAGVLAVRRHGWPAAPGAVLVGAASVSFLHSHIYWPRGVLTMLGLAAGWAALWWAAGRRRRD
jgi:hypothetical protein